MNEKLNIQAYPKIPSIQLGIILLISYLSFTYLSVDLLKLIYIHWKLLPKFISQFDLYKLNINLLVYIFDLLFVSGITFFLVKKYRTFLLTNTWKSDFFRYMMVGLKWASPIIVLTVVYLCIPFMRQKQFENEDFFRHYKNNIQNLQVATVLFRSAFLIIGSVLEELIYRGVIQNNLYKFLNRYWCILISTVFFLLMHVLYYSIFSFVNFRSLINWFFGSLIYSIAFDRRRSCISSVVPHLIHNSWGIILNPITFVLKKY